MNENILHFINLVPCKPFPVNQYVPSSLSRRKITPSSYLLSSSFPCVMSKGLQAFVIFILVSRCVKKLLSWHISPAFRRSINTASGDECCSSTFSCTWRKVKIVSIAPQPGLKPAWESEIIGSSFGCSRSTIIRATTFLATLSREIPLSLGVCNRKRIPEVSRYYLSFPDFPEKA